MLGTGGAGLAPPRPSAQQAALPKAPPPAAAAAPVAPAAAPAPAAQPKVHDDEGDPALATTKRQATDPIAAGAPTEREDSKRFLAGDPMAPPGSAQTGGRSPRRSSTEEPVIPGVNAPGTTGKLLGIAIGGVVMIALVGYLAARFMGLLN